MIYRNGETEAGVSGVARTSWSRAFGFWSLVSALSREDRRVVCGAAGHRWLVEVVSARDGCCCWLLLCDCVIVVRSVLSRLEVNPGLFLRSHCKGGGLCWGNTVWTPSLRQIVGG